MKKKKSSIGCLFWVALILLILVIFLFNRKTISNVIESTGFLTFLTKDKTEQTMPDVNRKEIEPSEETKPEEDSTEVIEVAPEPEKEMEKEKDKEVEPPEPADEPPKGEERSVRNARLFFIDVNDNGSIRLQAVVRQVYFQDSPLTETIKALLRGLLPSELNQELLTLIPDNTQLLSATVKNGTAYLNFNEDFKFNTLGSEGLRAQLRQIVYTATEFSSVKNVQILIENEKQDYLGPEGVFIGAPLNRNSF